MHEQGGMRFVGQLNTMG